MENHIKLKNILLALIALFVFTASYSQNFPVKATHGSPTTLDSSVGGVTSGVGLINKNYSDTASANGNTYLKNYSGSQIFTSSNNSFYVRSSPPVKWLLVSGGGGGSTVPVFPTAITSLATIGFVPGTTDAGQWINNVFYQSQPPTVTLTGGQTLELRSAGTNPYTLNYSSSRQAATATLATIVVAGVTKSFVQPSAPGTVSGTQTVTVTNNTDVTYSNVTTTTDGKSATATTSFVFQPKRYFGFINDSTGIGVFGFNDAVITALGNELSTSKSKSFNTGNPTGVQFLVYAYYAPFGFLTQLDLNGFPSIDAFNVVQRNFTNSLGYTGQWIIYWSKNGQTLSSTVIAN